MSEASAGAEAESNGAEERIRTSTGLPPPAPQAGASAVPPLPRRGEELIEYRPDRLRSEMAILQRPAWVSSFAVTRVTWLAGTLTAVVQR